MPRPLLQLQRDVVREGGFALVLVIWGLGLISLLVVSVMTTARYRVISAGNVAESAKAEALAEAGVNFMRLELLAGLLGAAPENSELVADGRPRLCVMPGGALAALAVEDEGGKVDLNTASPKLLASLLHGFGADLTRQTVLLPPLPNSPVLPPAERSITQSFRRIAPTAEAMDPRRRRSRPRSSSIRCWACDPISSGRSCLV